MKEQKTFKEKVDYRALGFKCGIEVHQQLDTKRKLFCFCPVGLQATAPDAFAAQECPPPRF